MKSVRNGVDCEVRAVLIKAEREGFNTLVGYFDDKINDLYFRMSAKETRIRALENEVSELLDRL